MKKLIWLVVLAIAGVEAYGRFALKLTPGYTNSDLGTALASFVEFEPRTGLAYRVNVDQLIDSPSADFSFLFKTNEIGLRDRPMGTHLRSELKFLVFGDEFAEGWGADIDQAFVVQAQTLVNGKTGLNPPIRTVIAAKSGYGAAQNYLIASALIDTLKPRGIVMFYSSLMPHADARFLALADVDGGIAKGLKESAPRTPLMPHAEDYPARPPALLVKAAAFSVAARLAAEMWGVRLAHPDLSPGDPVTDRLAGIRGEDLKAVHAPSLRHVQALADLAASRRIPFTLVHIPLPPQVAENVWTEGRKLFGLPAGMVGTDDREVVAAFCAESRLRCMSLHDFLRDTAAASSGKRLYHEHELALTGSGTNAVAGWFADHLLTWMDELGLRP